MGILVVGTTFMDVKGYPLAKFNQAGRNSGTVEFAHGGVGRNIAEDIGNIGLNPTFLSLVENDANGQMILDRLNEHGVDTSYIQSCKDGMGMWVAVFNNDGDVVASISKRFDFKLVLTILEEKGDEIIEAADSVALEIDVDADVSAKIMELAVKHNKDVYAVISNMSIAIEHRELFDYVKCLVCNQEEAGIFFSEKYLGMSSTVLKAVLAEKVKAFNIPNMVVTMGGKGSICASLVPDPAHKNKMEAEVSFIPSLKVEVVDTTGAGDSFFAGVCAGMTYGKSLPEACSIGNRLAASVIQTKLNVCPNYKPEEFGLNNI